ncbi:HEAT repeat-containing protein 4-like isoform X2 [Acanthaster planci]|uniref:HEAT repeat-containing protein 4-like isoform X2 n=1 Tax=Acanthaster planci TaxID=133434 RepID=A0A8B7Z4P7_ACAPL|nr:HEAT repeat-containing protein 4-like isoform X2 [Acanthaster planci]
MAMDRVPQHPELFPCGDRIKVPQVGADASNLKGRFSLAGLRPTPYFGQRQNMLRRDYLQKISSDLLFSEDVVKTHAAHTLPYDRHSIQDAYDYSGIIQREKKQCVGPVGRYNSRTTNQHLPCHIKKRSHHRLEPLRKPKLKPIGPATSEEDKETVRTESESKLGPKSLVFLTEDPLAIEASAEEASARQPQAKYSQNWDEHLLMNLSKNTARWIVGEQTAEGPQRDKLHRMLVDMYGEPPSHMDTLIHDDVSVSDMSISRDTVLTGSKVTSKQSGGMQQQQAGDNSAAGRNERGPAEDDINSRSLAAFYRQPDALRRQQKQMEKELAGSINSTAREIKVTRKKTKPPPTLKDVMNPAVGDKMYDTQNQFEQEWLSGAQQILQHDPSHLLLDTGNLYHVARQEDFPQDPTTWSGEGPTGAKRGPQEEAVTQRGHRGYKKWSQLPQAIQGDVSLTIHEAGYDPEAHREPDQSELRQYKQNQTLLTLVDEWRTKWHLGNRWYDSSIDDLVRDMSDIHEHVRLQAIATIAKAATYRPPAEPGVPIKSTFAQKALAAMNQRKTTGDSEGMLPDALLQCVEKALGDSSARVRVTAAIALYTLNKPNEEARKILNEVMRTGSEPERWAASQCLAHAGVCDSYVVGELIQQLLASQDVIKHERCMALLAKLSAGSTVVHSMVGEQLNSASWRQRIIACRVLPRLSGIINKDIMHKLNNLMWNDWHQDVRRAAAQTMGRTGHGKEVHDELRDRLLEGSERDRIDALNKVAHLGIMTARLLPAYLQCFSDAYIAVRIAATNTASQLSLEDPKVTQKLLFLTQFDNNWKVKAHAIKALGDIGKNSEPIQEAILWAVRFEAEPGVRAEALQSLVKLGIGGKHVAAMLQDKLLVEPDQLVRVQLAIALQSMGVSPTGDMEMVQQIKDKVRRLCTRYNIAAKITQNEIQEGLNEQKERFFNESPRTPDLKVKTRKPTPPRSSISTKQSQRSVTTPSILVDSDADENKTSDDEDYGPAKQTPDIALPKTPPSAGQDRGSLLSPLAAARTPGSGTPSRGRSPIEKLEKLIELYEGSCSVKEYKEYVKPEGEAEEEGEEQGRAKDAAVKLETIAESVEEEIRMLQQDSTNPSTSKESSPQGQDQEAITSQRPLQDQTAQTGNPSPTSKPPGSPLTTHSLDINSNLVTCEDEVLVTLTEKAADNKDDIVTASPGSRSSVDTPLPLETSDTLQNPENSSQTNGKEN